MVIAKNLLFALALIGLYGNLTAQSGGIQELKAQKNYEFHNYIQAIESYKRVLKDRPKDPEVLGRLGDCYRHLNQLNEAERYYAQAARDQKVDAVHLLNYGKVLKGLGRYREAKRFFEKYRQVNPELGRQFAKSCDFAEEKTRMTSQYFVEPESVINTPYAEFGPAFFRDEVVFSSARTDILRQSVDWKGAAKDQLFVATTNTDGLLSRPNFLKSAGRNFKDNEIYNIGPVSFSKDGGTVAFTRNNFTDGTRHLSTSGMQLKIYLADVTQTGEWINEREVDNLNLPDYNFGFPSLASNGTELYFASDMPGGFGGYDIYYTRLREDGQWEYPQLLGANVNSPGDEITPYFDGKSLFFSSDYHQGFGGYDIFRAEQSSDGRWSTIFHLGTEINSSRDDYGFIYDTFRNIGYFTSNRTDGNGKEDIYRVFKQSDNIVIKVRNAADGLPIPSASIDFAACDTDAGPFKTNSSGVYKFQASQGLSCNIVISKEGYVDKSYQLSVSGLKSNRNIEITLNKSGEESFGRVIDYINQSPVSGVKVEAINQLTKSLIEAQTDLNGYYALALSPGATYIIRYSSIGYRDIQQVIRNVDPNRKDLLGITRIYPTSALTGNPEDGLVDGATDPYDQGSIIEEYDEGSDFKFSYAVQVAALNKDDISRYTKLETYGGVYTKQENNMYKVRVGPFDTKQKAERVQKTLKKSYKGAFIVQEREAIGKPRSVDNRFDDRRPEEFDSPAFVGSKYMVQLAAYSKPEYFDESKVRDYGQVVERKKGSLTIMYLSGFNNLGDARYALSQAKRAGFPGAYVVMVENGALVKVK